jgi:hypothetical protein
MNSIYSKGLNVVGKDVNCVANRILLELSATVAAYISYYKDSLFICLPF